MRAFKVRCLSAETAEEGIRTSVLRSYSYVAVRVLTRGSRVIEERGGEEKIDEKVTNEEMNMIINQPLT